MLYEKTAHPPTLSCGRGRFTAAAPLSFVRALCCALLALSLLGSVASAQDTTRTVKPLRTTTALQTGAALGLGVLGVGAVCGVQYGIFAVGGYDLSNEGFRAAFVSGAIAASALVPMLTAAGATLVARPRGGKGSYGASVLGGLVGGVAGAGVALAIVIPATISTSGEIDAAWAAPIGTAAGLLGAVAGSVLSYQWSDRRVQTLSHWVPSLAPSLQGRGAALAWSGKF